MKKLLPAILALSTITAIAQETWENWFADGKLDDFQVVSGFANYKVEDGVLIGTTAEGSPNSFLATKKQYKDFEIQFEVKIDDELNSGLQVRSHLAKEGDAAPEGSKSGKPLPAGRLVGPQCEIAVGSKSGDFYDEARRGTWWSILTKTEAVQTDAAKSAFKKGEWNQFRVVVKGDHYQSWVNGVLTADFQQPNDPEGYLGFQVHGIKKGAGPFSARWRNVKFRTL